MSSISQYVVRHSPRQAEIVGDILKRIQSNELPPGAGLPSVVELSRNYSASPVTVQRAIVHLRERGYIETNTQGSSVSRQPPHLSRFGIVSPYTPHPSQFRTALEKEANHLSEVPSAHGIERRFSFFYEVDHPDESIRRQSELMSAIAEHLVGGLIFFGPTRNVAQIARKSAGIPCVGFFIEPVSGVSNIKLCGFEELALDRLKTAGCSRAALITSRYHSRATAERFMQLVRERGMTTYPRWIHGLHPASVDWGENCAQMLLHGKDRPDAIIIDDDNLVPYVTAGIAASQVSVPGDLTVIAHTNFPHPTHSEVPVIRIGFDVRLLMNLAVEIIETRRRGGNVVDEVALPACSEEESLKRTTDV